MSFTYEWTEQYATGIDTIDEQHKMLFGYVGTLDAAMKCHDDVRMHQIATNLLDYAVSHCAYEEELMEQSGYPFYEQHKHGHDLFRERVAQYLQRLNEGEDTYHVAREIRTEIALWLSGHIGHEDQDYVPYVMAMTNHGILHRIMDRLFG